jgi:hypothetical protein
MSARWWSALVLGAVMVLTGCSDGGDSGSFKDTNGSQDSSASPSGPTYTQFEDFPGDDMVYVEYGMPVGLRLKIVDAVWTAEFTGTPAQAGNHFLVVYVAVTGELDDRGVEGARLDRLTLGLRFASDAADCKDSGDEGHCRFDPYPVTLPEQVADDQWREHSWQAAEYSSVDMAAGETLIAAAAFQIPDTIDEIGDVDFCGTNREELTLGYRNCVTTQGPDRS